MEATFRCVRVVTKVLQPNRAASVSVLSLTVTRRTYVGINRAAPRDRWCTGGCLDARLWRRSTSVGMLKRNAAGQPWRSGFPAFDGCFTGRLHGGVGLGLFDSLRDLGLDWHLDPGAPDLISPSASRQGVVNVTKAGVGTDCPQCGDA